jgi:hypothetical protein
MIFSVGRSNHGLHHGILQLSSQELLDAKASQNWRRDIFVDNIISRQQKHYRCHFQKEYQNVLHYDNLEICGLGPSQMFLPKCSGVCNIKVKIAQKRHANLAGLYYCSIRRCEVFRSTLKHLVGMIRGCRIFDLGFVGGAKKSVTNLQD